MFQSNIEAAAEILEHTVREFHNPVYFVVLFLCVLKKYVVLFNCYSTGWKDIFSVWMMHSLLTLESLKLANSDSEKVQEN